MTGIPVPAPQQILWDTGPGIGSEDERWCPAPAVAEGDGKTGNKPPALQAAALSTKRTEEKEKILCWAGWHSCTVLDPAPHGSTQGLGLCGMFRVGLGQICWV